MILNIFITLFAISILLIILDYLFKKKDIKVFSDFPALMITGYTIMFILGILTLGTGVHYPIGHTTTTNYYYDAEFTINYTFTNETTTYKEIQGDIGIIDVSHIIGFILAILGFSGFMYSLFDLKGGRGEKPDYE